MDLDWFLILPGPTVSKLWPGRMKEGSIQSSSHSSLVMGLAVSSLHFWLCMLWAKAVPTGIQPQALRAALGAGGATLIEKWCTRGVH